MAKTSSYKKQTTTTVKAVGYVDLEKEIIETEEGNITFKDLLKDFNGEYIEFQVKEKVDEELPFDITSSNEDEL